MKPKPTARNTPSGMTTGSMAHRVYLALVELEYQQVIIDITEAAGQSEFAARQLLCSLWS